MSHEKVVSYNREAWNQEVRSKNRWTIPVSAEEVEAARSGKFKLLLTPKRKIPKRWIGKLEGKRVLCLASGGGQQGPLLAAAGANVTVYDLSDEQLAQDRKVAKREKLKLKTVQGDMRDMSAFKNQSFDLIVHPVSNCFCPELKPVWKECARVLRSKGRLCFGFMKPEFYIFDQDAIDRGVLIVKHKLPYSDLDQNAHKGFEYEPKEGFPLEFSHSWDEQIGELLRAGFVLNDFFEDHWHSEFQSSPENQLMPCFAAALATKK